MAGLGRTARAFLRLYEQNYQTHQHAARIAETLVSAILRDGGLTANLVVGRAKSPASVAAKLRRRRYKDPEKQLTDAIGVRVVTYSHDEVDAVVTALAKRLAIDAKKSVDRRHSLGLRDFGYRSVHLIVRLKDPQGARPEFAPLRNRWFEIQVRSILENAWAEIEHQVVYKSGIEFPDTVRRRFAAIAGTLEVLENGFLELRGTRNKLIEQYRDRYNAGRDMRKGLDAARLLAYLEHARGQGLSWREAEADHRPFPSRLDSGCVEALSAVGISTARALQEIMNTRAFQTAVRTFAAANGIEPARVSHLALVIIAVALTNRTVLENHFPDIIRDPSIQQFLFQLAGHRR